MIKSTGPDSACLLHSRSFNSGGKHLPLICLCSGCADVWPTEWGSSCYRNEGLCSGVSCNAQWNWSLDTAMVPSFHHFRGIESFLVRWRLRHLSVWDGLVGILLALNPSWCQINQTWLSVKTFGFLSLVLLLTTHTVKAQSWIYAWPGGFDCFFIFGDLEILSSTWVSSFWYA